MLFPRAVVDAIISPTNQTRHRLLIAQARLPMMDAPATPRAMPCAPDAQATLGKPALRPQDPERFSVQPDHFRALAGPLKG